MKNYHDSTLKFLVIDPFLCVCKLSLTCGTPEGNYFLSVIEVSGLFELETRYMEEIFSEHGGVSSLHIENSEAFSRLEMYGAQGWKVVMKGKSIAIVDTQITEVELDELKDKDH